MHLVTGALNGNFLVNYLPGDDVELSWVKAAIAYASMDAKLPPLIQHCFDNKIRLTYWGRYDSSVPIAPRILKAFLDKRSPNYVCKLVPDIYHPKVIWWGGYGAYIGSANLTDNGWYGNIECGIFLEESELIETGMDVELDDFFQQIDEMSEPLTEEIYNEQLDLLEKRKKLEAQSNSVNDEFNKKRRIAKRNHLTVVGDKKSRDENAKTAFLREWDSTLTIMRDIAALVSDDAHRPAWIPRSIPAGAQADQFLHAYYYNVVSEGRKRLVNEFFEKNRKDPEKAREEIADWWRQLASPPSHEDQTLFQWLPLHQRLLSKDKIMSLTKEEFTSVCMRVHAMRDHSLRVRNETYALPKNSPKKNRDECITLLAEYLWKQRTSTNKSVLDIFYYVFYGGSVDDVPSRIWDAHRSEEWSIPHLGVSSLGEIVGWAMPDKFPPRNGRTSKALRALGYDVQVYLE